MTAVEPVTDGEPGAVAPVSRMAVALLAVIGFFVAVYLLLYKMGFIGSLLCGPEGGCQTVQLSPWAAILGIRVAAYGVAGYLVIAVLAFLGMQPGREDDRRIGIALLVLGAGAFLFSVYLTLLEAFIIDAWCRWCVASAVIATLIFAFSLAEVPRIRNARTR